MHQPLQIRLEVDAVSLRFGEVQVLRDTSLLVPDFGITALIGPNGAGKTALLNAITGIYKPQAGRILLDGEDIVGRSPNEIARKRIGRCFQHLELFNRLTVSENLLVFRDQYFRGNPLSTIGFFGAVARQEARERAIIEDVIDFFELWQYRDMPAKSLPYGIQKVIGCARAMALDPKLLLLDEPASGLTREEKENLARFILRLRSDWKVPILWIEHDMDMVMDLADRIHVLELGHCIASGSAAEIRHDERVRASYLGAAVQ